MHGGHDKD